MRATGSLGAAIALLRPSQWVKNVFVIAPVLLTPSALTFANLVNAAGAFASFCGLASAVYILNDYKDRSADRAHPTKRARPLASGAVAVPAALLLMAVMALIGFGLAAALPGHFLAVATIYVAANVAYSFGLKHISLLDVLIVAVGFILRVEAGSEATGVTASIWLVITTGLLALFLALAKRRDDLVHEVDEEHRKSLDGYTVPFLDVAVSVVLGALLVAYLTYTTDQGVMQRLGTRHVYYTTPFVVAGILRYLQIAIVEHRSGAPSEIVIKDRFMISAIVGWIATFALLLYA